MRVSSLVQVTRLNSRNILIILTVMILSLDHYSGDCSFLQNDELSVDYDDDEFSIFQIRTIYLQYHFFNVIHTDTVDGGLRRGSMCG
jgi:hypothetical protein